MSHSLTSTPHVAALTVAALHRHEADHLGQSSTPLLVSSTESSTSSSTPEDSPYSSNPSHSPSSTSPSPSPSPSAFFPAIQPGSAIHSALITLCNAGEGCQSSPQSGPSHNNHFHLHLHNYLSSHSSTIATSARMVACDRALETLRPASDRLFTDPLASVLAGSELMEKALNRQREVVERQRRQPLEQQQTPSQSPTHVADPTVPLVPSAVEGGRRMGPETDPTKTPRVAIRTRFFDDFLRSIAEHHPLHLRQLMLVGCGMDSRAYRLDCLETKGQLCCFTFELDQEAILKYKDNVLRSVHRVISPTSGQAYEEDPLEIRCKRRITVPIDLTDSTTHPVTPTFILDADSQLQQPSTSALPSPSHSPPPSLPLSQWAYGLLNDTPFNASVPSVWLLEGNLMYLTPTQQLRVLRDISYLSCVGSFLGFSHINERALLNVQRSGAAWGVLNSTFLSCLDAPLLQALADWGWELLKFTQIGAHDANYGRWLAPVYPIDDTEHGITLYICAIKVKGMKVNDQPIDQRMDLKATLAFSADTTTDSTDSHSGSSGGAEEGDDVKSQASEEDLDFVEGPASSFHSFPVLSSNSFQQRERIVDSWNQRASQYDELVRTQPLFSVLAHRLLDLLTWPSVESRSSFLARFHAIDLACGTGCVSDALLSRYPLAQVHLIDPSAAMMNLARPRLEGKYGSTFMLSSNLLRAEDVHLLSTQFSFIPVSAIVCSGAMHFMREEDIYPALAPLMQNGASFVYNLWGHPTSHDDNGQWKQIVNLALAQHQEPPYYPPPPSISSSALPPRSFESLSAIATNCGLMVDEMVMDEDEVGCDVQIQYAAMNAQWLGKLGKKREAVLERAMQLARKETMTVRTTRVRVSKPG